MTWYSRILDGGDTIAIVGLGRENLQFLTWLIEVVDIDISRLILADGADTPPPFLQPLLDAYPTLRTFFGAQYLQCLQPEHGVRWVIKTPGVWSNLPEIQAFRRTHGEDSIHNSLVFFIETCRTNSIGITGTKGKTTTSSMIAHMLRSVSTSAVHYCGNSTNLSPYQFWTDAYNPPQSDIFVLELSSFQLQDLDCAKISPAIAVVTSYFVDHLDQHASIEEYWAAKDAIIRHQKPGDVAIVSTQMMSRTQLAFLNTSPIIISPHTARDYINSLNGSLHLPGEHNSVNATQAAYAVAAIMLAQTSQNTYHDEEKLPDILRSWIAVHTQQLVDSIATFIGVPHRLQPIGSYTIDGIQVRLWDDGAAAEPDAVAAAIRAVCSSQSVTLLHLTGVDKGGELQDCIEAVSEALDAQHLYGVCGNGSIAQRFADEHGSISYINPMDASFRDTVTQMYPDIIGTLVQQAHAQDVTTVNLLFSPCGSSFDEFESYTQRATWWAEQSQELLTKTRNESAITQS